MLLDKFEVITQLKGVYFFSESNDELLIAKTPFDVKPTLTVDGSPLIVDLHVIRKMAVVGPDFVKKVNLRNCFPVFRKAILKISSDEKGEDHDNEIWDWDAKLTPVRSFGSSGLLPFSNENM